MGSPPCPCGHVYSSTRDYKDHDCNVPKNTPENPPDEQSLDMRVCYLETWVKEFESLRERMAKGLDDT